MRIVSAKKAFGPALLFVLVVACAVALVLACVHPALADEGNAVPSEKPAIVLGQDVRSAYTQLASFSLRGSGVEVSLSSEKRATLRTQADMSALSWLVKMLTIECSESQDAASAQQLGVAVDAPTDEELVEALAREDWYDTLEVRNLPVSTEAREFLLELRTYGAATLLLNASEGEQLALLRTAASLGLYGNPDPNQDDLENVKRIISGKIEEIYNARFAAVLAEELSGAFAVSVPFVVQALPDDGSLDKRFGVDGATVMRGTLPEGPIELSRVEFGAPGQFFDAVAQEGMKAYLAGEAAASNVLDDGRSLADHLAVVDGSAVVPAPEDGALQRWARFGIPASYYASLPLLENGALRTVEAPSADLIVAAAFDKHGKLLSLSKPIATRANYDALLAHPAFEGLPDGTYRYQLVQGNVSAEGSVASEEFAFESGQAVIDVTVKTDGEGVRALAAQLAFVQEDATQADGASSSDDAPVLSSAGSFVNRVGAAEAAASEQDRELTPEEELVVALARGEQTTILDNKDSKDDQAAGDAAQGGEDAAADSIASASSAATRSDVSSSGAQEQLETLPAQTVDAAHEQPASDALGHEQGSAQDQEHSAVQRSGTQDDSKPSSVQPAASAKPLPTQYPTQRIVASLTATTGDASLVIALIALLASLAGFIFLASAKLHRFNASAN